jgi:flagellar basal body-associated protein FliL
MENAIIVFILVCIGGAGLIFLPEFGKVRYQDQQKRKQSQPQPNPLPVYVVVQENDIIDMKKEGNEWTQSNQKLLQ